MPVDPEELIGAVTELLKHEFDDWNFFSREWFLKSCFFRRNSVNSFTTSLTSSHSYLRYSRDSEPGSG